MLRPQPSRECRVPRVGQCELALRPNSWIARERKRTRRRGSGKRSVLFQLGRCNLLGNVRGSEAWCERKAREMEYRLGRISRTRLRRRLGTVGAGSADRIDPWLVRCLSRWRALFVAALLSGIFICLGLLRSICVGCTTNDRVVLDWWLVGLAAGFWVLIMGKCWLLKSLFFRYSNSLSEWKFSRGTSGHYWCVIRAW